MTVVTTVGAPHREPSAYEDVDSLLRRLRVVPAAEPAQLGHLAGKSSPGWGWA
jgi:hypothetical protein